MSPETKAFVDYSGKRIGIVDPTTGEIHEAEIFVGVLGASNLTYAEATWTQQLPDWTGAHVRMFRFFGGAPIMSRMFTTGRSDRARISSAGLEHQADYLAGVRLVISDHAMGLPVLRALSLCTCCRQYPGAAAGRRLRSSRASARLRDPHRRFAAVGRLVRALRRANGRDGVHRRLLDTCLRTA
jgi:hypothetical protein